MNALGPAAGRDARPRPLSIESAAKSCGYLMMQGISLLVQQTPAEYGGEAPKRARPSSTRRSRTSTRNRREAVPNWGRFDAHVWLG
jgi:hypothetical protein